MLRRAFTNEAKTCGPTYLLQHVLTIRNKIGNTRDNLVLRKPDFDGIAFSAFTKGALGFCQEYLAYLARLEDALETYGLMILFMTEGNASCARKASTRVELGKLAFAWKIQVQ